MCADLDEQLHRWSIDTIDDNDRCIVCLQKLEQYAVGNDGATVAAHPLIIPDGHERGVMVTVGIDDGTRLETAEISRLCDGDFVAFHGVLRFLSGSQVENRSLSSHVSELMDGDVEIGILDKLVNADALCEIF